jgi:hypothetical protein
MARYGESATTLTWGAGLLVAGVVGLLGSQIGGLWHVAAGYGTSDAETVRAALSAVVGIAIVSGLTAVLGLAMTLVGIWRAATNIDTVAREVAEAAAEAGRDEAYRREEESFVSREALEQFRAGAGADEEAEGTDRA